ncbi:tetratricopeptide repeat protein [Thermoflexibacter ruber]|uniref:Tetratricopeptide repeat-containing protein n=1 Tax=Thermoflexibacter ruber TaxID=1003 RepID=A0A1I2A7X1_9BACT|nr:tetratricopeptide repeat protein [Thermoflexibacter ruber]SFE40135.1 Tetratricopeptide repeat-containing protein [Thermoflexibacter ruber]
MAKTKTDTVQTEVKKTATSKENTNLEIFESAEALQSRLSKTEEFAKNNQKLLAGVGIGIVVIVLGIILYQWNIQSRNAEAQKELFPAQFYFEKDSIRKALKGDNANTTIGLEAIAEEYGSTKAGKLANFYIGIAKLKEGKYDEAIEALENFNPGDLLLQARVYSLIGDAYMEKNDFVNAISYYKKASNYNPNEYFTPIYMSKLALAQEQNKDLEGARETYKRIVDEFEQSSEKANAQKRLAMLDQKLGKK